MEAPLDRYEISDEELAALALDADPEQAVDADAVALTFIDADEGLLPPWYMPAPSPGTRRGTRRVVLGALAVALVAVNAVGLCVTSGFPELPW